MVGLAGGTRGGLLLDPRGGGGPLVRGAAMFAPASPRGHARAFGFERLAGFDHRRWKEVRDAALARRKPKERLPIFGRDPYGEELKKAPPHPETAGPADRVALKKAHGLDNRRPAGAGGLPP